MTDRERNAQRIEDEARGVWLESRYAGTRPEVEYLPAPEGTAVQARYPMRAGGQQACGASTEAGGRVQWTCTRPYGHEGPHVAHGFTLACALWFGVRR